MQIPKGSSSAPAPTTISCPECGGNFEVSDLEKVEPPEPNIRECSSCSLHFSAPEGAGVEYCNCPSRCFNFHEIHSLYFTTSCWKCIILFTTK